LTARKSTVNVVGQKVAEFTAEQLETGVNLSAAVLAAGPIAEQVKAVKAAVEAKNRFHHDAIFRGIVLSNVPEWVYAAIPRDQLETKKQEIIQERLGQLPAMDAVVAKALELKANTFEIVPVK